MGQVSCALAKGDHGDPGVGVEPILTCECWIDTLLKCSASSKRFRDIDRQIQDKWDFC